MTVHRTIRRAAVSLGVIGALLGAAMVVRAAGAWAADNAQLSVAPVSVTSLESALDQERARSAALEQQLAGLQQSSTELAAALASAQLRLQSDAATADELRDNLDAAQARLKRLETALREAAARAAAAGTSSTGATTTGAYEDDEDHEDDEDDEDHEDGAR